MAASSTFPIVLSGAIGFQDLGSWRVGFLGFRRVIVTDYLKCEWPESRHPLTRFVRERMSVYGRCWSTLVNTSSGHGALSRAAACMTFSISWFVNDWWSSGLE